jgi:hypothetical protein
MGAHRKIRGYFFQFLKTHAGYSTRTPGVSTFNALTPYKRGQGVERFVGGAARSPAGG